MAFDFLSRLNQCRAEQAPAPPSLAPVIDVPGQRDADQIEHLARIVATSTLREELRERCGDDLDVRVAFHIVSAVLAAYREALAEGGTR